MHYNVQIVDRMSGVFVYQESAFVQNAAAAATQISEATTRAIAAVGRYTAAKTIASRDAGSSESQLQVEVRTYP